MSNSSYRPDVDGLRAIAVLAVVVYHLQHSYLHGGYLGVDIFFVISGFLITGIILREQEQGRFSFLAFYARRIRRIYPALAAVIIATLAGAAILVLPPDFGNLADSARWAILGVSNLYFWAQSGYFEPTATRLPLLHTWSLGVEEQFYLAWPLLMVFGLPLLTRLRLPRVTLIAAVIVLSLGIAFVLNSRDQTALFYSPLARAWELGFGAAVAFARPIGNRVVSTIAALAGAAAIAGVLYLPGDAGLRPELIACAAAALIIWPSATPTIVARALALPPIRFIGLISYSVYLWHWPILTLFRYYYRFGETFTHTDIAIYLVAVATISVLSWAFIERPFRNWRSPSGRTVAAGLVLGAVMAGVFSFAVTDGLAWRFSEHIRYLTSSAFTRGGTGNPPGATCFLRSEIVNAGAKYTEDLCIRMDPDRPDVLVIGDSHSNQFMRALRKVFPEINFSQASASSCFSLLTDVGGGYCEDLAKQIYASYLPRYGFDGVILSSRWRDTKDFRKLSATLKRIRELGAEPVVLGPSPEYSLDPPSILAYGELRHVELASKLEHNVQVKKIDKLLRTDVPPLAPYFSTYDIVCPDKPCQSMTPKGEPMLQDENHLSAPGALYVMTALRQEGLLADILAKAGQ